ncbi:MULTISPECIES: hypothetical protein [Thalassospira]|uniref:alpha/beta hydrolase family protein n=1 Tax=Thalassospira TaxID=168934 RepID=UPI000AE865C9|nr:MULTISPECIES: hypothetical protein [Thalassospira]MDM7977438.1 hypothetical protein [Thalassospira xiamenensis]
MMKPIYLAVAFFLAAGLKTSPVLAEPQTDYAGYDRFDVRAVHRSMPIAASVWYPADTFIYRAPVGRNIIWKGTDAYVGAAIAPGQHPLVLLSHGSGGNMDGLGWLSSQLALRGAIVVAVNHPGTTSGDSSPRRTPLIGERAADISATLDQVLSNTAFAPYIDRQNISAIGFSLGGTTVLNLAGVRFDQTLYAQYCDKFGNAAQDCDFLRKGGVDPDHLPDDFAASSRDDRIVRSVAIEPGMGFAATQTSLAEVTSAMLFIGLGEENKWVAADFGPNGSNLVARIKNASSATFAPAYHLTFLGECMPGAAEILKEEGSEPICSDPPGTDRAQIHQKIVLAIAEFLNLAGS